MAEQAAAAVLFNLNVILDVLERREPHYEAAARAWALVETARLRGLVAAHSLTTLHYLLAKYACTTRAREVLRDLLRVFAVAAVDRSVVDEALHLGWDDFEDAVQMAAAARGGAGYLVTRNPKDFGDGPIPVVQPEELVALFAADESPVEKTT